MAEAIVETGALVVAAAVAVAVAAAIKKAMVMISEKQTILIISPTD